MSSGEASPSKPEVESAFNTLPDHVLLDHIIPKLGPSDRLVLAQVDRRTHTLAQVDAREGDRLHVGDFVNSVARLRWALESDCPWDESTCTTAVEGRHLEVLKWARGQDPPCPWDAKTCAKAARMGQLETLKWMREQDPPCPWDEMTCAKAAAGGHLETLIWIRAQDPPCQWNGKTSGHAAKAGRLEVLKWIRMQHPPCPWDIYTCWAAAWGAQL